MPTVGATRVWVVDEVLSASNMNTFISQPIEDSAGRNGVQELEDSLIVQDGSGGDRYIGLPSGTTAQRPASPAQAMARWNRDDQAVDIHDGTDWQQVLTTARVTTEALIANGDIGTGSNQVAAGDHHHTPVVTSHIATVTEPSLGGWDTLMTHSVTTTDPNTLVVIGYGANGSISTDDVGLRILKGTSEVHQTLAGQVPTLYREILATAQTVTYSLQARRTTFGGIADDEQIRWNVLTISY